MTTATGGLKVRHIFYAICAVGVIYLGMQVYTGTQRDPRDITFTVNVPAGGRVTHVNWRADGVGAGNPSFSGHDWTHDVTLPRPGTWTLHLQAVVEPLKVKGANGNWIFRGATTTCKIISAHGTAVNVGPSEVGRGCAVSKIVVIPPDE